MPSIATYSDDCDVLAIFADLGTAQYGINLPFPILHTDRIKNVNSAYSCPWNHEHNVETRGYLSSLTMLAAFSSGVTQPLGCG